MEYFIEAFRRFADFSGRATRKEYWMFVLFYTIFYLVLATLDAFLEILFLEVVFYLVTVIPSISIAARRLHDTGRSGWWQLILFIPLIGLIVLIVFLAQGSHGENEYGPNPKMS